MPSSASDTTSWSSGCRTWRRFELPKATHLLQVENPGGMAEALDAFFAHHPMT